MSPSDLDATGNIVAEALASRKVGSIARNVDLVDQLRAGRRTEAAEGLRSYLDAGEAELLGHLEAETGL